MSIAEKLGVGGYQHKMLNAVIEGDAATVEELIAKKCPVDLVIPDVENTLVHIAAMRGHAEVIRLLCEAGAPIDARNSDNHTALHEAARHDKGEACKVLLECGASKSARANFNENALHFASKHGGVTAAKALVEGGCKIGAKGKNGYTALHKAVRNGNTKMVRALLDLGASLSQKTFYRVTPEQLSKTPGVSSDSTRTLLAARIAQAERKKKVLKERAAKEAAAAA